MSLERERERQGGEEEWVRKYDGVSTGSWVGFQHGKETESDRFEACFTVFLVGRVSFLSSSYIALYIWDRTHTHTHTFIWFQILDSQNRKQEVFLSFTRAQSLQWQAGRTAAVWVKPLVYFMIKGIYLPVCPQNSHVHLLLAASCVRIRMKW